MILRGQFLMSKQRIVVKAVQFISYIKLGLTKKVKGIRISVFVFLVLKQTIATQKPQFFLVPIVQFAKLSNLSIKFKQYFCS